MERYRHWIMFPALAVLMAMALAIGCRPVSASTTQPVTKVFDWDFSNSNQISNIKEPLEFSFDTGYIHDEGTLKVRLKNGDFGTIEFSMIQVWRDPKRPNRVRGITVFMRPETQKGVADSATGLALAWGITNLEAIIQFRQRPLRSFEINPRPIMVRDTKDDVQVGLTRKKPSPYSVEINPSGGHQTPFLRFSEYSDFVRLRQ